MADRADGSIIINTKMDNSGFGKGSAEMKSAISSLQHQVDALGKRMDSTFAQMQRTMSNSARSAQQYSKAVSNASKASGKNKQAESVEERFDRIRKSLDEINEAAAKVKAGDPKALDEYNAKVRQAREDIESLTREITQAAQTPVKTQAFKELEEMIEKTDNKLQAMYDRREKMERHGQKNSRAYNNLNKDIEQAQEELEGLRDERYDMLNDKTNDPDMSAYIDPSQTEQFIQYEEALAGFHNALTDMRDELAETFGKTYTFEVETQQAQTQGPEVADPESVASTAVETQISQLQTALDQLNSTGDKVVSGAAQAASLTGAEYRSALDGVTESLSIFDEQSDTVQEQIAQCRTALEEFGNTTFKNQSFVDLETEAEQVGARLQDLTAQEQQMDDAGLGNTEAYSSLEEQIAQCTARLVELGNQMSSMKAAGTDMFTGSETDAFQGYTQALDNFEGRLQGMQGEVDAAVSPSGMAEARWSQMSTLSGILENALFSAANAATRFSANAGMAFQHPVQAINRLGVAALRTAGHLGAMAGSHIINGLKGIARAAGEAAKKFLGFGKSVKGSTGALQGGLWNIIKYGIGVRSVFALVNRLRNAIKEGFTNLAQVSSPVNSAINSVMGSLSLLKNSLATAFAPIFTAIAPAIVYLCNLLATAMSYIAQFMSAITGGRTYMKATKGAENFAKGVGKAGSAAAGAAKEASKQLASFDKLDILKDDSSGSGGGGGGGGGGAADVAGMFEEMPIESAISDFIKQIKDAFAAGDYEEVGRIIAEGINGAVAKIRDFISWDNVHTFWEYWIDVFCRIANSLVKNIDWYLIGETIAEGFNTLLHILELLLTGIDWKQIGRAIGTGLNGIVDYIDWGLLGRVIAERFQAALDVLYGAVTTFNWKSLGKGIADSINSFVGVIDWEEVGQTYSSGVRGLLQALTAAISGVNWWDVGKALADALGAVDWGGIIHDVFAGLGSITGGLAALLGGFLSEAVEGAKQYFEEKIEECGGNVVAGILKGIWDAILGVGKWIADNVLSPFIEGFKDAFGIHSPAKETEPIGENIFEGILKGILTKVGSIGKWIKNHVGKPLKEGLSKLFSGDLKGSDILEVSVSLIKKGWSTLKGFIGTAVSVSISLIKKAWTTIAKFVGTAVSVSVSLVKKAWSTVAKFVGTAVSVSISLIKKAWTTIAKFVGTAVSVSISLVKKAWTTIAKFVGTAVSVSISLVKKAWTTIAKFVGTAVSVSISLVKKAWSTISGFVGTAVSVGISLFKKAWSSISGFIGTAVSVGISLFKSGWYSISSFIGTAVSVGISLFKSGWSSIARFVGTSVSVGISLFKSGWSSIRSFFGLSGGGIVGASGGVKMFSSGGVIRNGRPSWWDSVQKYASGTARAHGTAFVAGEAGPEIVGHVNGRTEVLNKSQIAATMHAAVLSAMSEAANAFAAFLNAKLAECANGIISAVYAASDISFPIPVSMKIEDLDLGRYAGMLSGLSAMGGVSYTAPVVSTGTIMPYSVTVSDVSLDKLANTIEESNDELGQSVVSAIGSAAIAIITAVQQAQARGEAADLTGVTQRTIDDINRRTRMYSASPII